MYDFVALGTVAVQEADVGVGHQDVEVPTDGLQGEAGVRLEALGEREVAVTPDLMNILHIILLTMSHRILIIVMIILLQIL